MESSQCLEDYNGAAVTQELCFPDHDQIAADIKALVDATGIKNVFIGSDADPRIGSLTEKIGSGVSLRCALC